MPLQYVGGTSGVGTSTGYTVSLTGLTGGIASAPAADDIVVVFSGFGNTAASAPAISGNNSGAYSFVPGTTSYHQNDTWDTEFAAFAKVMGGTPDTSLTVTRVTNAAYGGATVVMVWRGFDPADPFDVTATVAGAGNASRPNPPLITPITAGAVILAGGTGMQTTAGGAFTTSANMTGPSVSTFSNGTTSDCGTCIAAHDWTTGSFTPDAVTGGTTSTSGSWRSMTLALRPFVAVDHATTGDLTGPGAEIVGSADRQAGSVTHDTTGTLSGLDAAIVGAAARTRAHPTSGTLTGQDAEIVGAAARTRAHATDGVLTGPGATVDGSAARAAAQSIEIYWLEAEAGAAAHVTTGALTGPGSTLAGAAARTRAHATDGTLAGPGTTVVGSAARTRAHATTGVLAGQGSAIAGTAARERSHPTTGVLSGPGAVVVGSAARVGAPPDHQTTGTLVGPGAVVEGSAAVSTGVRFPGFEVDMEPATWWTRKPKAEPVERARAKLQAVAQVVSQTAQEHLDEQLEERASRAWRKAAVRARIEPLIQEMPGFDWVAMYDRAYSTLLALEIRRRMDEADQLARQAIERIRARDEDDVVALLLSL